SKVNGYSLVDKMKIKENQKTIIGNDVFIGANVIVLDGVRIGNGAVIGAGAVVVNDIPDYAVAVGVPARVVKYRFDKYTISRLQNLEWWNWSLDDLKKVELNFWNVSDFIR
ncbi:MAG: CatB-related O-acetyltransferase, partial [Paludibacteraceae bacterium]